MKLTLSVDDSQEFPFFCSACGRMAVAGRPKTQPPAVVELGGMVQETCYFCRVALAPESNALFQVLQGRKPAVDAWSLVGKGVPCCAACFHTRTDIEK